MSVDRFERLGHEFDKRVLHHIPRALGIAAQQPRGITDERSLLLREKARQKSRVFMNMLPWTRRWISHGVLQLDAPPRTFLEKIFAIRASRGFAASMFPTRLPPVVALVFLLLLASSCSKHETATEEGIRTQTLLIGNLAEPASLDPHLVTALTEGNILNALLEGLTVLDETTSEPLPGVAEKWDISDDGLIYTFHLRPASKWSNGDRITAGDFVYSFNRILLPKFAAEYSYMLWPIKNAEAFNTGRITNFSEVGITAIDDSTLRIVLERPTPYLPALAAHVTWMPVHRATIEKFGQADNRTSRWTRPENFVGNGAFTLTEWTPNARIVVSKNPNYWDAANNQLNRVIFFPIENSETEERNFRAGQLHITFDLPKAKIPSYRAAIPSPLRIDPLLHITYLNFNITKPPFNDPRVRRALALAIDRETIARTVLNGAWPAAHSFTPPSCAGYVPPAQPGHDFSAARRLLEEAGFPGGKNFPAFAVQVLNDANQPRIMEAVQEMWQRELGVKMTIEPSEQKIWLQTQRSMAHTAGTLGWYGDFADPVTFLALLTTGNGNNWSGWSNAEYDSLLKRAANTADPRARYQILQQAERLMQDACPVVPLFHKAANYLIHPAVKNWAPSPLGMHRYQLIRLEK
jgi:oligopeptide transport system substrate-binding protein